ncbi:MAG: family 78 glycoside hydrolase catalytic domain, partial [Parabacteroides sp.]
MKSKAPYFIILFLVPLFLNAALSHTVFNLRCEQEETPVGLETLQPRFSWQTNATGRNFEQSAWQILVSDSPEQLQNNKGDIWDSGKVESSVSVLVPFAGKELKAGAVYYWKVRNWDKAGNYSPWSQVASFSVGLLSEKDWNGARWIALERDKKEELLPVGLHGFSSYVKKFPEGKKIGFYLLPQFRKTFTTNKTVKRAVAYISGLGQFELFINGKKIGNNFLDPGWTKYDKCALYLTFDVTNQIQNGDNTVGVMLGNGFFNIPSERYFKVLASYGAPRLKMKLAIEYTDGSMQNLVTGTDWKASASPVTYSSIYGGEDYDANREQSGWMMPGFNDKNWSKALDTNWQTKLLSQQSTPLHVRDSISPVRIFKNQKGQWVYDLGQNFSGIVRISVKASKSQYIKIWPAELLFADSTVDQRGSGSPYWFGYTPKADGRQENWQPQFTYYGFRYVAVEGAVPAGKSNAEGLPEIAELTGLHTCNFADEVGYFHCSKPLFNQIYELIDWAIRSNMASVLTDCPHREKLG